MFLHYIDWFPIVCFPFFDYIPLYIPYYPHIAISSIRNPHTIPLTLVMTTINLIYSLPANIKHYYVSIFHYNYVSLDSVWFIIIIAHCVYPAAFPYSMIYFHCWIIWTTLNNYIYIYIHIYIYICTYYDISIIQPTLSMQRASWSWFPALGKLKGRPVLVLWPWGPSETSDCTDGSWKFASWSQKTRRTTAWRFLWCTTSLPQWCITELKLFVPKSQKEEPEALVLVPQPKRQRTKGPAPWAHVKATWQIFEHDTLRMASTKIARLRSIDEKQLGPHALTTFYRMIPHILSRNKSKTSFMYHMNYNSSTRWR